MEPEPENWIENYKILLTQKPLVASAVLDINVNQFMVEFDV